jgi:hypothetical protein
MSIETLEATEKRNRTPLYTGVAMGITVWTVGMLFLAIKLLSIDVYWLSYYAVVSPARSSDWRHPAGTSMWH